MAKKKREPRAPATMRARFESMGCPNDDIDHPELELVFRVPRALLADVHTAGHFICGDVTLTLSEPQAEPL
jgi:hypothetical protein